MPLYMHHLPLLCMWQKPKSTYDWEILQKHCIIQSVKLILGEQASQAMKRISLSNVTTKSRINKISENVKSKVISKIDSLLFLLFCRMKLPMFPISNCFLCISGMSQIKGLIRNSLLSTFGNNIKGSRCFSSID